MNRPPTDREALIAALAAEAEETRSTGTDGPEPEKLLDFLAGRLRPEEEERLSSYLLANPEASRALLDLADLEAAGAQAADPAAQRPAEIATVAAWRDLERRLPTSPTPSRFRKLQRLLPSIAAMLLVSTISLATLVWRYHEKLSQPVANLQTLSLLSTRAGTEPSVAPPSGDPVRLLIDTHRTQCSSYEARVEGPSPGNHRTIQGLERTDSGHLTSLVRLKPGTYTLRLYGCEPRREIGNRRFHVRSN